MFSIIHGNGRTLTALPLHTKSGGGLGTRLECICSAESVWHVGVPYIVVNFFVAAEHGTYGFLACGWLLSEHC